MVDLWGVLRKNRESGPVAQLGARFHGMEEVIGSIPIRSTKQLFTNQVVARRSRPPSGSDFVSFCVRDATSVLQPCAERQPLCRLMPIFSDPNRLVPAIHD